jgi:hypothetical protein
MGAQNAAVIPDAPQARSGTHLSLDRSIDGGDIWIPALPRLKAGVGRDDSRDVGASWRK